MFEGSWFRGGRRRKTGNDFFRVSSKFFAEESCRDVTLRDAIQQGDLVGHLSRTRLNIIRLAKIDLN